ncbi:hypothetical protein M758_UG120000 [Ceratodon purpureus]|nr:hypothetical protein M758_UG120000 [Ceratodon purpureus]
MVKLRGKGKARRYVKIWEDYIFRWFGLQFVRGSAGSKLLLLGLQGLTDSGCLRRRAFFLVCVFLGFVLLVLLHEVSLGGLVGRSFPEMRLDVAVFRRSGFFVGHAFVEIRPGKRSCGMN